MVASLIRRWFERRRTLSRMADEEEFFAAWDQVGEWDVDSRTGERYQPAWDSSTGEWVYRDRRVKGEVPSHD